MRLTHSVNSLRDNRRVQPDRSLSGPWLALAAIRFLAEVGMLGALAYVGWRLLDDQPPLALILAVFLCGSAAATWGAWVAPKAGHRLEDPARLAVEVALFGVTCIALLVVGNETARIGALVLGLAYAVSAPVGRKGF